MTSTGVLCDIEAVVAGLRYMPGWSFSTVGYGGNAKGLVITVRTLDSRAMAPSWPPVTTAATMRPYESFGSYTGTGVGLPDNLITVAHHMQLPPGEGWSRADWERWVLDQILLVHRHEACEFFAIGEDKVFYPNHGEEGNPYAIRRRGDEQPPQQGATP